MASVVHSLISRGLCHASEKIRSAQLSVQDNHPDVKIDLSPAAMVLLAVTATIFVLLSFQIRYTLGELVATLAMVESPSTTTVVCSDEDTKTEDGAIHQEILVVKSKPVTSSLRSTMKHLRERGGYNSRIRGLGLFVLYTISYHLIAKVFSSGVDYKILRHGFAHIATTILLCRVDMAWTHTVISEPSGKSLWSRLFGGHTARKIVAPTAIVAVVEQLAISVPITLFRALHVKELLKNRHALKELSHQARAIFGLKITAVVLSTILVGVLIIFPTHVALRRVQASMLAEDEQSIIPFDRTFGGKVVPEALGGTGRLSLRDAWKTFEWSAALRVVKAYVKAILMQAATAILFAGLIALELKLMTGGKINKHMLMKAFKHGH